MADRQGSSLSFSFRASRRASPSCERQLNLELGAAKAGPPDTDMAAMCSDVAASQEQADAEPAGTAVLPLIALFEDQLPFRLGNSRARVFDGNQGAGNSVPLAAAQRKMEDSSRGAIRRLSMLDRIDEQIQEAHLDRILVEESCDVFLNLSGHC